ncbi:MAG: HlyC/CorC family transporter [Anaerolineae bacterium]|nr:MAG: HlyC/CorC family transporter [Anaerolineae bacterium]
MTGFEITLILLLLVTDMAVTAARSGLLNVRYGKLVSMGEQGILSVEATVNLVQRRIRLRSSFKLAQSVLRFTMGGLLLALVLPWEVNQQPALMALAVLVGVALVVWLIEFAVERTILRDPERWAVRFTPLGSLLMTLLSPLVALPMRFSDPASNRNLVTITEEELRNLLDAGEEAGVIEAEESEMIQSVFELGETLAREIMVPRVDMLTLDVSTPLEEAADELLASGYSRVPVYDDHSENIIGILYTKDMLKAWRSGDGIHSLRELLRPVNFIPETKKLTELVNEMQAHRNHMAIVVDEYGGISGLVTLEDIVEEIFGEIQDEYDIDEDQLAERIGPDEFVFHGRINLDEVNDLMGTHLPVDDAETLGGLIYQLVGRVPRKGERLRVDGLALTVEQLSDRRIRKVRAKRVADAGPNEVPESED